MHQTIFAENSESVKLLNNQLFNLKGLRQLQLNIKYVSIYLKVTH